MKKKIFKTLIAIVVILVFINRTSIIENFKFIFEKTPEKYKNYKGLRVLSKDENFDIDIIETDRIDYGKIETDSLTWFLKYKTNKDQPDEKIYYKLNSEGVVIDSLKLVNESVYEEANYLVNFEESYYYTWLLDNSTERKSFTLIKEGLILTKEELAPYIKNAEYLDDDIYKIDENTKERVKKIVFFKDNTWFEALSKVDDYISEIYYDSTDTELSFLELTSVIKASYYKKTEWISEIYPNLSIHINGKQPDHWRGISYYELKSNNTIIPFTDSYTRLYKSEKHPRTKLSIYQSPNGKFALISNGGYGNSDYTLYLIRF